MKKLPLISGSLMALLPGGVALAASPVTAPTVFTTVGGFLGAICTIANILFTILIILAVVILLVAAFMFLTSGGSEEKTSSARGMLTYAVVGIVVALLAKGAVLAVGNIFVDAADLPQCG